MGQNDRPSVKFNDLLGELYDKHYEELAGLLGHTDDAFYAIQKFLCEQARLAQEGSDGQ
jgi:hypothetical protein